MRRAALIACVAGCAAIPPREPIVSVYKQTDAGCLALVTVDEPADPQLDLGERCAGDAPLIFAGVDLIEVAIDYGGVDFASSTTAPSPALAVTADGQPSDVAIEISPEHRLGEQAYFLATFHAPVLPTNDLRITAGVEAGFETTTGSLEVVGVPVVVTLDECGPGPGCELVADLGDAHVRVTLPGDATQEVALRQIIDGVAGAAIPPVETVATQPGSVATVLLPVPATSEGGQWTLVARVGVSTSAPATITLHAPAIAASLSCGTACTVATGAQVGLSVTAPPTIHGTHALVTTHIAGIPDLVDAPIDLVAGAGVATLVAPTRRGAWQIDVSVDGYPAPAIVATVQ